jgi:hypothetical protein
VADAVQDVDVGGALIASSSALSVARSSQRSSIIQWRSSALSASLSLRQQTQRHSQPSLVLIGDPRRAQVDVATSAGQQCLNLLRAEPLGVLSRYERQHVPPV